MKKFFIILTALFASITLSIFIVSCGDNGINGNGPIDPDPGPGDNDVEFTIISPYSSVNWETDGQFKAALHTHTRDSDGSSSLAGVVEHHFAAPQSFDILAITDHHIGDPRLTEAQRTPFPVSVDWLTRHAEPLTQQRFEEIRDGVGREGRGMLMIPYSSELAVYPDEINSFFFNNTETRPFAIRTALQRIQAADGLTFINHPGRATGGNVAGNIGLNAVNNRTNINRYAAFFNDFSTLVGMEIINREDGDSRHDRIFWDNLLRVVIPRGERSIWGFSNDDSHSNAGVNHSYNMFVMPENTIENFRATMVGGNFYAVARVARREGVLVVRDSPLRVHPTPRITNIVITGNESADATITITAQNYERIEWITAGSNAESFTVGNTLVLSDYADEIEVFVRANIIGLGGIAFTQPFTVLTN